MSVWATCVFEAQVNSAVNVEKNNNVLAALRKGTLILTSRVYVDSAKHN